MSRSLSVKKPIKEVTLNKDEKPLSVSSSSSSVFFSLAVSAFSSFIADKKHFLLIYLQSSTFFDVKFDKKLDNFIKP